MLVVAYSDSRVLWLRLFLLVDVMLGTGSGNWGAGPALTETRCNELDNTQQLSSAR